MPEQVRVEQTEEAPPRPLIFPCFDGLRAIGAVMVMAHHVGNNTGEFERYTPGTILARFEVALAILFMVSGFLMFRPFALAAVAGRRVRIGAYFKRRFFRIFPGYWMALFVVWFVLDDFKAEGLPRGPVDLVGYMSLAYNYFDRYMLAPLQHAWTLNIELAFYFFMPAYAWLVNRFGQTSRQRFRAHLWGLVGVFVAHQVFATVVLAGSHDRWEQRLHWLPGYLGTIVFGMGLAVLSAGQEQGLVRLPRFTQERAFPAVSWGASTAFFLALAYGFDLPTNRLEYTAGQWELVYLFDIVISVFLIVPAVFGPQDQGTVRKFLRVRPVAFTGLVSYGFYLWHIPLIGRYYDWTGATRGEGGYFWLFAWTLGLSVLAGALSFYLVERPAQRLGGSAAVNRKVGRAEVAGRA